MKSQQLIRLDKINVEPIYLLTKKHEFNKYTFEVCGSTKNIYKVQIYTTSNMIYCNCPDARSYAKHSGVICKHSCFILVKVLKMIRQADYFNIYLLDEEQLEHINHTFHLLEFRDNDFIKMDYIDKYKNLTDLTDLTITINAETESICPICYDELTEIENKKLNNQCICCSKIFHNNCLNKWLSLGNTTCPYCRHLIKSNNNYKSLE
jgi:hypothetical protein